VPKCCQKDKQPSKVYWSLEPRAAGALPKCMDA